MQLSDRALGLKFKVTFLLYSCHQCPLTPLWNPYRQKIEYIPAPELHNKMGLDCGVDINDSAGVNEYPQLDSIWSDDTLNAYLRDCSTYNDTKDLECGEFSKSFMDSLFRDNSDQNYDAIVNNSSYKPVVKYTEEQVKEAECTLDRMYRDIRKAPNKNISAYEFEIFSFYILNSFLILISEKSNQGTVIGDEGYAMIDKLMKMFETVF
ncbi:MAG: hypothetical protein MHMPM18_002457, partial [Marteilia pararefringens]